MNKPDVSKSAADFSSHFPPVEQAWGAEAPVPGLLAWGGDLSCDTLLAAYRLGIFPWFQEQQPILWWSPHPRMVLHTQEFRLHRSLFKTLRKMLRDGTLEIKIDHDFEKIIRCCANARRQQTGTWIQESMIAAYLRLHEKTWAHCVEAWIHGQLAGGLYCVNIGQAVFGESMFSLQRDASKLALCALVAFCRSHRIRWIDCQQDTPHMRSLGARCVPGPTFMNMLKNTIDLPPPTWAFLPEHWASLWTDPPAA